MRKAVLNDLSPAATFIAYNYNTPLEVVAFEREAKKVLNEVEKECGWMYQTLHQATENQCKQALESLKTTIKPNLTNLPIGCVNYIVWSDVFVCSECLSEVVFWHEAIDEDAGKVLDQFPCPHCNASLTKRNIERAWTNLYDREIKKTLKQAKQVPVLITYSVGKKRFNKTPDSYDLALIGKINKHESQSWIPSDLLPDGYNTAQPMNSHGITHVHHFYTKRNLLILSKLKEKVKNTRLELILTGIACRSTQMNRIHMKNFFFGGGGWNAGYLKGTLYIPSVPIETSVFDQIRDRSRSLCRAFNSINNHKHNLVSTSSSTKSVKINNSLDYIFIDPPFGSNLNYSELNVIWEAWLQVLTNNELEAIENKVQGKGANEYRKLMTDCFKEAYRLLKPGRWMTVEFSNTKAVVWNNIQTALTEAGFIVANVSALDKKQGSFKAVNTPTAVKQDLVISAYKPNGGFEDRFEIESIQEGVWDFVRTHLSYLPVFKKQGSEILPIQERDPRILFDQMVAYFVRKGLDVPLDSQEFQVGLRERFDERDGMFFLPAQYEEYNKNRQSSNQLRQLSIFVDDEASAIEWLRQQLNDKPKTYQEIHPLYINELSGWKKNEVQLELSELLEQNFLCYDGVELVPGQIHNYLSTNFKDQRNLDKDDPVLKAKAKSRWYVPNPDRAQDLEKLRERSLLREFEEYKQFSGKKMKSFRLEVIRAGFKKAWQEKDYALIVQIAGKIPDASLQEDPKLLMWYDQALTRLDS